MKADLQKEKWASLKAPVFLESLLKRYDSRRESIQPLYERIFELACSLIEPAELCEAFPAKSLPSLVLHLPGAERIMLGVCTLGPGIDSKISELCRSDLASAVILDEIGTAWILAIANDMYRKIRADADAIGLQSSPSFRPGIGQWPLEYQRVILDHLKTKDLGIALSDGMMLIPQKSISMIVAIGERLGRTRFSERGQE